MDMALNNLQWLICHKTQSNHYHYLLIYSDPKCVVSVRVSFMGQIKLFNLLQCLKLFNYKQTNGQY